MNKSIETSNIALDNNDFNEQKKRQVLLSPITPSKKIKVFISSRCGDRGKFDHVRDELKNAIEGTQLAQVYLFEQTGPSTLSAELHYSWNLEDSDVCIFLIDNAEKVPDGVLKEHEIVKSRNIKALYYFCDETSRKKTALEESITGAKFAKSATVHRFEDLIQGGVQGLIDDIITIYIDYCKNRFLIGDYNYDVLENVYTEFNGYEKLQVPQIPKSLFKNLDKCKIFILKMMGIPLRKLDFEDICSSDIDGWGANILEMLFEGKSIKSINCAMLLETLRNIQDEDYHKLVCLRWNAIQEYFTGEEEKCIQNLEEALQQAKDMNQPSWIIDDILIDIRNQSLVLDTINNTYSESSAQKELNKSTEALYYPLLDRFYQSLQEKYIESFYKETLKSPNAITFGDNYDELVTLLASAFIVTVFNGSLTHIILFYEKIRELMFYLSSVSDERNFKKVLLKFVIFQGDGNNVSALCNSHPEILNLMTADEAEEILRFCDNQVIAYKKSSIRLLAFGTIGYYLNDQIFNNYESIILDDIEKWIEDDQRVIAVGGYIFKNLMGVSHRLSQDKLAKLCISFMEKHFSRWYFDMFKFIENSIDLNKMNVDVAKSLISCILNLLENDKERELVSCNPGFLCVLRNQNRKLTDDLDLKILEYIPEFYNDIYKLETTDEEQKDLPVFVQKYIDKVGNSNNTQGGNGIYFVSGLREINILRSLLVDDRYECPAELIDSAIVTSSDTLLISKESISTKLDAISLLVSVVIKYPEEFEKNGLVFKNILKQKEEICNINNTFMDANIDKISLNVGLCFLEIAMGEEAYAELLRCMACIHDDTANILAIEKIIKEYLELDDKITLPKEIDALILQYILQWADYNYIDVRWLATIILFQLLRNTKNRGTINQKIINLIESDGVYIKNLIQKQMRHTSGLYRKTKEYVISKCKSDENYVVRKVCEEEKVKNCE